MADKERPGKVYLMNGRPIPDYDWDKVDDNLHVPVKCTKDECYGCQFCAGGLYGCEVCNGFEGSIPRTCPGRRLTEEESNKIYARKLDFFDNTWWVPAEKQDDVSKE